MNKTSIIPPCKRKKNRYSLKLQDNIKLEINSNFENGNIRLLKRISKYEFLLQCVNDNEQSSQKKAWFYFTIKSKANITIKIYIKNVSIYDYPGSEQVKQVPYYKEGFFGSWKSYDSSYIDKLYLHKENQTNVMVIDYTFKNQFTTYFCLTIPFTYTDNEIYLEGLKENVHQNIEYEDKIVAKTQGDLNIHCISITEGPKEQNKPIVLITARVHPGEVSSSYCLQGILNFLIQSFNIQSYLLRRLFIFKIFPMLNPEGIVQGNYRMDIKGNNLNRYYQRPSVSQHPAIYKVIEFIKQVQSNNRKIEFYFDLHSHSNNKEAFIYGNAFDDIVQQTYSELFCKILEKNYEFFKYGLCNFDEKQMKAKDKGQSLTKQGCGRVVLQKTCNLIKSYTVQSSMFAFYYENNSSYTRNKPFNTSTAKYSLNNQLYTHETSSESITPAIIFQNKKLGHALLISILDLYFKNPSSNFSQAKYATFIQQLLSKFNTYEKFKVNSSNKIQHKQQVINLIKDNYVRKTLQLWGNCHELLQTINSIHQPNFIKIQPNISLVKQIQSFTRLNATSNDKKIINYKIKTRNKRANSLTHNKSKLKTQVYAFQNKIQDNNTFQLKKKPLNYYPQIRYSMELNKQFQSKIKFTQESQASVIVGKNLNNKSKIEVWNRKNTPKDTALHHNKSLKQNLILLKYVNHYKLKPNKNQFKKLNLLRIQSSKNNTLHHITTYNNTTNNQRQQKQHSQILILKQKMQKHIQSLPSGQYLHAKSYKFPKNHTKTQYLYHSDRQKQQNQSYVNICFDIDNVEDQDHININKSKESICGQ